MLNVPALVTVVVVCLSHWPCIITSYGRQREPPGRSTMWIRGFKTPINFLDNRLSCVVYEDENQISYDCGVCGNSYDGRRDSEPGGKYATGTIVRTYTQGQSVRFQVDLTGSHGGYFEFKICPKSNPNDKEEQECFDLYSVSLANNSGMRYNVTEGNGVLNVNFRLPPDLTCDFCVLQWRYYEGSIKWPQKYRKRCIGCSDQRMYHACTDIRIVSQLGKVQSKKAHSSFTHKNIFQNFQKNLQSDFRRKRFTKRNELHLNPWMNTFDNSDLNSKLTLPNSPVIDNGLNLQLPSGSLNLNDLGNQLNVPAMGNLGNQFMNQIPGLNDNLSPFFNNPAYNGLHIPDPSIFNDQSNLFKMNTLPHIQLPSDQFSGVPTEMNNPNTNNLHKSFTHQSSNSQTSSSSSSSFHHAKGNLQHNGDGKFTGKANLNLNNLHNSMLHHQSSTSHNSFSSSSSSFKHAKSNLHHNGAGVSTGHTNQNLNGLHNSLVHHKSSSSQSSSSSLSSSSIQHAKNIIAPGNLQSNGVSFSPNLNNLHNSMVHHQASSSKSSSSSSSSSSIQHAKSIIAPGNLQRNGPFSSPNLNNLHNSLVQHQASSSQSSSSSSSSLIQHAKNVHVLPSNLQKSGISLSPNLNGLHNSMVHHQASSSQSSSSSSSSSSIQHANNVNVPYGNIQNNRVGLSTGQTIPDLSNLHNSVVQHQAASSKSSNSSSSSLSVKHANILQVPSGNLQRNSVGQFSGQSIPHLNNLHNSMVHHQASSSQSSSLSSSSSVQHANNVNVPSGSLQNNRVGVFTGKAIPNLNSLQNSLIHHQTSSSQSSSSSSSSSIKQAKGIQLFPGNLQRNGESPSPNINSLHNSMLRHQASSSKSSSSSSSSSSIQQAENVPYGNLQQNKVFPGLTNLNSNNQQSSVINHQASSSNTSSLSSSSSSLQHAKSIQNPFGYHQVKAMANTGRANSNNVNAFKNSLAHQSPTATTHSLSLNSPSLNNSQVSSLNNVDASHNIQQSAITQFPNSEKYGLPSYSTNVFDKQKQTTQDLANTHDFNQIKVNQGFKNDKILSQSQIQQLINTIVGSSSQENPLLVSNQNGHSSQNTVVINNLNTDPNIDKSKHFQQSLIQQYPKSETKDILSSSSMSLDIKKQPSQDQIGTNYLSKISVSPSFQSGNSLQQSETQQSIATNGAGSSTTVKTQIHNGHDSPSSDSLNKHKADLNMDISSSPQPTPKQQITETVTIPSSLKNVVDRQKQNSQGLSDIHDAKQFNVNSGLQIGYSLQQSQIQQPKTSNSASSSSINSLLNTGQNDHGLSDTVVLDNPNANPNVDKSKNVQQSIIQQLPNSEIKNSLTSSTNILDNQKQTSEDLSKTHGLNQINVNSVFQNDKTLQQSLIQQPQSTHAGSSSLVESFQSTNKNGQDLLSSTVQQPLIQEFPKSEKLGIISYPAIVMAKPKQTTHVVSNKLGLNQSEVNFSFKTLQPSNIQQKININAATSSSVNSLLNTNTDDHGLSSSTVLNSLNVKPNEDKSHNLHHSLVEKFPNSEIKSISSSSTNLLPKKKQTSQTLHKTQNLNKFNVNSGLQNGNSLQQSQTQQPINSNSVISSSIGSLLNANVNGYGLSDTVINNPNVSPKVDKIKHLQQSVIQQFPNSETKKTIASSINVLDDQKENSQRLSKTQDFKQIHVNSDFQNGKISQQSQIQQPLIETNTGGSTSSINSLHNTNIKGHSSAITGTVNNANVNSNVDKSKNFQQSLIQQLMKTGEKAILSSGTNVLHKQKATSHTQSHKHNQFNGFHNVNSLQQSQIHHPINSNSASSSINSLLNNNLNNHGLSDTLVLDNPNINPNVDKNKNLQQSVIQQFPNSETKKTTVSSINILDNKKQAFKQLSKTHGLNQININSDFQNGKNLQQSLIQQPLINTNAGSSSLSINSLHNTNVNGHGSSTATVFNNLNVNPNVDKSKNYQQPLIQQLPKSKMKSSLTSSINILDNKKQASEDLYKTQGLNQINVNSDFLKGKILQQSQIQQPLINTNAGSSHSSINSLLDINVKVHGSVNTEIVNPNADESKSFKQLVIQLPNTENKGTLSSSTNLLEKQKQIGHTLAKTQDLSQFNVNSGLQNGNSLQQSQIIHHPRTSNSASSSSINSLHNTNVNGHGLSDTILINNPNVNPNVDKSKNLQQSVIQQFPNSETKKTIASSINVLDNQKQASEDLSKTHGLNQIDVNSGFQNSKSLEQSQIQLPQINTNAASFPSSVNSLHNINVNDHGSMATGIVNNFIVNPTVDKSKNFQQTILSRTDFLNKQQPTTKELHDTHYLDQVNFNPGFQTGMSLKQSKIKQSINTGSSVSPVKTLVNINENGESSSNPEFLNNFNHNPNVDKSQTFLKSQIQLPNSKIQAAFPSANILDKQKPTSQSLINEQSMNQLNVSSGIQSSNSLQQSYITPSVNTNADNSFLIKPLVNTNQNSHGSSNSVGFDNLKVNPNVDKGQNMDQLLMNNLPNSASKAIMESSTNVLDKKKQTDQGVSNKNSLNKLNVHSDFQSSSSLQQSQIKEELNKINVNPNFQRDNSIQVEINQKLKEDSVGSSVLNQNGQSSPEVPALNKLKSNPNIDLSYSPQPSQTQRVPNYATKSTLLPSTYASHKQKETMNSLTDNDGLNQIIVNPSSKTGNNLQQPQIQQSIKTIPGNIPISVKILDNSNHNDYGSSSVAPVVINKPDVNQNLHNNNFLQDSVVKQPLPSDSSSASSENSRTSLIHEGINNQITSIPTIISQMNSKQILSENNDLHQSLSQQPSSSSLYTAIPSRMSSLNQDLNNQISPTPTTINQANPKQIVPNTKNLHQSLSQQPSSSSSYTSTPSRVSLLHQYLKNQISPIPTTMNQANPKEIIPNANNFHQLLSQQSPSSTSNAGLFSKSSLINQGLNNRVSYNPTTLNRANPQQIVPNHNNLHQLLSHQSSSSSSNTASSFSSSSSLHQGLNNQILSNPTTINQAQHKQFFPNTNNLHNLHSHKSSSSSSTSKTASSFSSNSLLHQGLNNQILSNPTTLNRANPQQIVPNYNNLQHLLSHQSSSSSSNTASSSSSSSSLHQGLNNQISPDQAHAKQIAPTHNNVNQLLSHQFSSSSSNTASSSSSSSLHHQGLNNQISSTMIQPNQANSKQIAPNTKNLHHSVSHQSSSSSSNSSSSFSSSSSLNHGLNNQIFDINQINTKQIYPNSNKEFPYLHKPNFDQINSQPNPFFHNIQNINTNINPDFLNGFSHFQGFPNMINSQFSNIGPTLAMNNHKIPFGVQNSLVPTTQHNPLAFNSLNYNKNNANNDLFSLNNNHIFGEHFSNSLQNPFSLLHNSAFSNINNMMQQPE